MPCNKCNTDFNLLNWKLKCLECEEYFCSKCLRKVEGDCVCEICEILIKRPPHRGKLMELKPKDLQHYLNKHNISTHGIVEKQELVELFYKNTIPKRKRTKKFSNPLSGSVPNIATRSQTYFSTLKNNAEAAFNSRNWNSGHSATNSPCRPAPPPPPQRDQPHQNLSRPRPPTPPADSPTTSTDSYEMIPTPPPEQNYETSRVEPSPEQPKKYPKLSDFTSTDDFNELSVKQLKELLTLNRVDYKGCVEKLELLERATRLWNDSNLRKTEESTDNLDEFCKICMDAPLDCVLLECGHMATCIDCGKRLAECPICRQYVTRVVRTFKA